MKTTGTKTAGRIGLARTTPDENSYQMEGMIMTRRTRLCLSLLLVLMACFALLPAQALAAGDFETPRELEVLSMSPAPVFRSGETITVFFVKPDGWGTPKICYWGITQSTYPGNDMTFSEYTDFGQSVYQATIPAGATGIIFNDGSNKTVDITEGIADGAMWYTTGEKAGDDYIVGWTQHTQQPSEQSNFEFDAVYAVGNGEGHWLNDVAWDPGAASNKMTETGDNIWQITYSDIDASNGYQVKFSIDGSWDDNFGVENSQSYDTGVWIDAKYNGGNIEFEVEEDESTVTLTLDLSDFDYQTKDGARFRIDVSNDDGPTEEPTEEPTEPATEEPTEEPSEPASEQPTELPSEEPQTEAYYLVGTMNDWQRDDAYRLRAVNGTDGKYAIYGVALERNDEFKIASSSGVWYPDGMENAYTITADGTYDVYFRPDGQGGEDWYYGCICVVASEGPTEQPTEGPTEQPTEGPTEGPTEVPTEQPTEEPSEPASEQPTEQPTNELTVYFVDVLNWGTPYICYWDYWYDGPEWPGVAMTFSEYNEYYERVYKATIPAGTARIIFNSNVNQTVDITSDIADGAMWYTTEYMNDEGHYIVGWAEHPTEQPSEQPSEHPTEQPSEHPSEQPSEQPSEPASELPTQQPTYTITIADGITHGTVSADVRQAAEDDTVTLTVTPAAGYVLASLTYTTDGGEPVAIADNQFTMPAYPVTVSAAFGPDPAHFEQTGDNEYTIHTATGWNVFCDCLNDNDTWNRFSGKTVYLGESITVSRMAGSNNHDFTGTFDGSSNTLTFEATAADNYLAPFRNVLGHSESAHAIIRNLNVATRITANDYRHMAGLIAIVYGYVDVTNCGVTVNITSAKGDTNTDLYPAGIASQVDSQAILSVSGCTVGGTIATDGKYAGGYIGTVQGSASITNSTSSVTISSTTSGDGTHGGYIGIVQGSASITGCVFKGCLHGASTNCCGGFVGWKNGTVNISNCIFDPADIITIGSSDSYTFSRRNANSISASYYTTPFGTAQGEAISLITLPDGATASAASGDTVDYDSKTWYIAGKTVTVTPPYGYALDSLTVYKTGDESTTVEVTDNSFTMPAYPVTVSAAFDPLDFEQTGDNEYTIYTAAGWGVFCDCLNDNDTWNRFSGKTVKLGANITVTRRAGSSHHDFCGTFDGDGKTLTFNYGGADSYKNEQYIAPFSYVSNVNDVPATIRNLHVAGDIYTSAKYAAGFISQFWGTVNIENCRSSVVINSGISGDGTHGGFVAEAHGTLNFTGCIFDGKLLTTNGTTSCGGFVGYGGTVNISDSLYAPAAIGAGETEVLGTESATFNRTASTLTNCYYTRTLGEAQGEAIGLITLPDGVTASAASGDTVDYDSKTWYIAGKTVTLNATSADGCGLDSLTYTYTPDGGEATTVTIEPVEGVYSFTMPAGDVTVSAVFMPFFEYEYFEYPGTIRLKKCNSDAKDITVPDNIPAEFWPADAPEGTTCSIIGEGAFAGLTKLENVTIGDNVNHLAGGKNGDGAFKGCTNLKTVTVGSNLDNVGEGCFKDCSSLTDFTTTSTKGDDFCGIEEIAENNPGLNVHCYHDSDIARDLCNYENVNFIYLDEEPVTHTCEVYYWDWGHFDVDGKVVAKIECSVCYKDIEFKEAIVSQVVDTPATCSAPGSGHYKATVTFDGQTFEDDDYGAHTYTLPATGHSFTYTVSGATITATCANERCPLTDGKATLTINAPESLVYDGAAKAATVTGDTTVLGTPSITYTKSGDASFTGTPTDAGTYTASITLGTGEGAATASVTYEIQYSITIDSNIANGKVTANKTSAAAGDTVTLTVTPAAGCVLNTLSVTQGETVVTVNTDNTFTMPAGNVTVTAVFVPDLTKWAGLQAAFSAASEEAEHPTAITLTQDVTAASTDAALTIPSGRYVALDLAGHTIDRGLRNAQVDGDVIRVEGDLTLSDSSANQTGKITGGNTSGNGGGVYVSGTFTMEGGSITGNTAWYGGGVYVIGGTFTMSGGSISGNTEHGDGGVCVIVGTFNLSGGSISGNTANRSGGGVYVNGTFNLSGGSISGNTAGTNYNGGGVYVGTSGTFNLSGAPTISGNVKGGAANNVYLPSGKTITVNGELTDGANLCVNAAADATVAVGSNYTITAADAACFHSDDASLAPVLDGSGAVVLKAAFIPSFGPANFTLPAATRTVEESAFEGNTAIGIVYVPDTCTSIGANAFKDCANLTQIRLPKNCTIGDGAFDGCTGLIAVYAPAGGTTETWCSGHNITFVAEAQA